MKRQGRKARINTIHIGKAHLSKDVPELYDRAKTVKPEVKGYALLNEALRRGLESIIAEEGKNE